MSQPQDDPFDAAAELFRALSNPIRLRLVIELLISPQCVHDLTDSTGASQSLVSQHLRVLRQARLVAGQRSGKEIIYSVSDEHVAHIVRDAVAHIEEGTS